MTEVKIASKQVITYQDLEVLCQAPMSQGRLILQLQNMIVALVSAQLGEVEAAKKAAEQGQQAAAVLDDSLSLKEKARALGVPDRRRAPLRRVTWCRQTSRVNKLECGHEFEVPSGQVRKAAKRRCVECLKASLQKA